jgi:formylglycine-generating enzyme
MVEVRGGTFQMGCTSEQQEDCEDNEKPVHSVTVSSFQVGKYEVSQKEWVAVMGTNPSYFKGDDLPVEQVSWNDVQEYIKKLNAKTGKTYRLPTEAEWEFAARGGNNSKKTQYSGGNIATDIGWLSGNSNYKTHPVGTKKANELDIYDMSGNVWEWCSDWYGAYSASEQTNPKGAKPSTYCVFRGGSWLNDPVILRVARRNSYTQDYRDNSIGFRLCRND